MPAELAHLPAPALPPVAEIDLVAAFLAGRRATTLRAYARDLDDFARFLSAPTAAAAAGLLTSGSGGQANALVLGYRAALVGRGLAPATVARRLAAIRSLVKLARSLGRVSWSIEVSSPKSESYRDTSGPGRSGWKAILECAQTCPRTPKALRDLALIRLLHDCALRRAEAVGISMADLDLTKGTVLVVGKGKTEPSPVTLPVAALRAVADWVAARGGAPGPLFVRLDRGAKPGAGASPVGGRAVHKIVRRLGARAGLSRPVRPHGLRHEAITRALDLTRGDVRAVRKFSRHAKVETLLRYDDNRLDLAGEVAALVSED